MPKASSRRYDPDTDTTPVLNFGKYRGQRVKAVWQHSPGYLVWCADNLSMPLAVVVAIDSLRGISRTFSEMTRQPVDEATYRYGDEPPF
jgi:hypothetical protein